jgi:hypothetical protein
MRDSNFRQNCRTLSSRGTSSKPESQGHRNPKAGECQDLLETKGDSHWGEILEKFKSMKSKDLIHARVGWLATEKAYVK